MRNFPFEHEGQTLWYSRAVVSSGYVYCKYKGVWYILAAKRSKHSTLSHQWNVPGGFLDHNETTKCAAQRETWEETGVLIYAYRFNLVNTNSIPKGINQHVIFSYACNLGKVKELPKSKKEQDEMETEDIRWIPLNEISKYSWINDQENNIRKFFKLYIKPSLIQRIKNSISNRIDQDWV